MVARSCFDPLVIVHGDLTDHIETFFDHIVTFYYIGALS